MSAEAANPQQQELRNFASLLTLTLEIAGLPKAEPGRHYNEGQMEARASTIRNAYKIAKRLIRDVAKDGAGAPAASAT
jgi:hypothetical protein